MKHSVIGLSVVALAACASTSVRERPFGFRYGLGPDLRVFTSNACLEADQADARSLDFIGEVITGTASLAVKSFGRFLEEVGAPETETASGVASSFYLDTRSEPPSFNNGMRCIYVVRDGFQSKEFDRDAPDDLKKMWTDLELTGTPSLFAVVRLDPAVDETDSVSNYFKATLLEFTAQRFARPGAESGRDYILTLEFVLPGSGRRYTVSDNGEFVYPPSGPFATGGFPLRGVTEGEYLRRADLKGLESGWLQGPPLENAIEGLPVNIYVDVVELKRGNPFLADFGRFLQSPPIASAAEDEITNMLDEDGRRQRRTESAVQAEREERRLVNALEEQSLAINDVLADTDSSPSQILAAVHDAEGAIADIQLRKREDGWQSTWPEALLSSVQAKANEGRQRIASP
ncbi:MAG: hypothetical protein R3C46_13485 [Hyphomonadaceae bacterium]